MKLNKTDIEEQVCQLTELELESLMEVLRDHAYKNNLRHVVAKGIMIDPDEVEDIIDLIRLTDSKPKRDEYINELKEALNL